MSDITNAVKALKSREILGRCINLIPFSLDYIDEVVNIRNYEKNKYFLNQTYELTKNSQYDWYKSYIYRNNDIYWCILNKKGDFIGTIRLYDITDTGDYCDQGSFMIDEKYANEGPYALEAELLSLDIAFHTIHVTKIINENRVDNKIMNNLTKKIGFVFIKNISIRNIQYNYYELNYKDYMKNRKKLDDLIEYWYNR